MSVIRWTGRNLFNFHEGSLKLASGQLKVNDGNFENGAFTIDMNTLACKDLTDTIWNTALIHHLRSTDFFDIEQFPTAQVKIVSAEKIDSTPGTPNYEITGELTLRGITKTLTFPAVIAQADDDHITAQAQMEFDRTEFGSHYGSGKLFAFLGKHLVNDFVQLHLRIQAVRK